MRVSIVDIEGDAASVDERGASVEAQEAANLQLYEQALLQHATNPAEAAASYAQLLAQPIVAEAVAEARVAADEGELVRRPSLQLKFLALKNLALLEADRGERPGLAPTDPDHSPDPGPDPGPDPRADQSGQPRAEIWPDPRAARVWADRSTPTTLTTPTALTSTPGEPGRAVGMLLQAVQIHCRDAVLWQRLGVLAGRTAQLQLARHALEQAVACSPSRRVPRPSTEPRPCAQAA